MQCRPVEKNIIPIGYDRTAPRIGTWLSEHPWPLPVSDRRHLLSGIVDIPEIARMDQVIPCHELCILLLRVYNGRSMTAIQAISFFRLPSETAYYHAIVVYDGQSP